MCKLLSGYNILFLVGTVSIYIMVAIAVQRYFAICRPMSFHTSETPHKAVKVIILIWIWSCVLALPIMYGISYAEKGQANAGAHCRFSVPYSDNLWPKAMIVVYLVGHYVIPGMIMVFCFVKITFAMQKQELIIEGQEKFLQAAQLKRLEQRRQTIYTVLMVVLVFVILWTPNQVIYLCFNLRVNSNNLQWNSDTFQMSIVMCFLSNCVNPFIYGFCSRHFRDGFKQCVRCCLQPRRNNSGEYNQFA